MTHRPRARWSLLAVIAITAVATTTGAGATASQDPGSVLRIGTTIPTYVDPVTLANAASASPCDFRVNGLLHETLLGQDSSGNLVDGLAQRWEVSDDGSTWTFTLGDHRWSDGEPLTADHVVAAFESRGADRSFASLFGTSYTVDAPDERTVVFTLPNGNPSHLWRFTGPGGIVTRPGDGFAESAGDYDVVDFEPGSSLTAERTDAAGPRLPPVIQFVPVGAGQGLAALADGTADIVAIGPEQVAAARKAKFKVAIAPTGSGAVADLYYTRDGAPTLFANPAVRRALALAIDREGFADDLFGGFPDATSVLAGPGWSDRSQEWPDYDPEESRRLLEEAGWNFDELLRIRVAESIGPTAADFAAFLSDNLAEVGVDADVVVAPTADATADFHGGAADVLITPFLQASFPGDTPRTRLDGPFADATGAATAFTGSELEALADEAAVTSDAKARAKLIAEFERAFFDEMPYVPMFYAPNVVAWNPKTVSGSPKPASSPCGPPGLAGVRVR